MGCGNSKNPNVRDYVDNPAKFEAPTKYIFGLEERFEEGKPSFIPKILEFNLQSMQVKNIQAPKNMQIFAGSSCLVTGIDNVYVTGGYDGFGQYTTKCFQYHPFTNTTIEMAPLGISRAYHCSTISGGRLFVFGGKRKVFTNDPNLSKETEVPPENAKEIATSTCEVLNFKTLKWELLPSMKKARAFAYCYNSKDQIYIFGGLNQNKSKPMRIHTIEQFSTTTNKWAIHSLKLTYGIVSSGVILHPSENSLIILGGNYEGKVHWNLEFDFENGYLLTREPLKYARANCVSGTFHNKIYTLGGENLNSIEFTDINKFEWNVKANVISSDVLKGDLDYKFSASNTVLTLDDTKKPSSISQIGLGKTNYEDIVFVFGDPNNPFILQIDTKNEDILCKPIPAPLALYNNQPGIKLRNTSPPQYFFVGGIQNTNVTVNKVFIYEPYANKARRLPNMPTKRELSSVVQKDNTIYVIGGKDFKEGEEALNTVEKYDLLTNKWEIVAPLNIKRYSSTAFLVNNSIYITGGSAGKPYEFQGKVSATEIVEVLEKYNDSQNKWEPLKIKLQANIHSGLVLQSSNQEVLILGGQFINAKGKKELSNQVWQYSFKSEGGDNVVETKLTMLGQARKNFMGAKTPRGYLLLAGGENGCCEFYDNSWKLTAQEFSKNIFLRAEILNKGNDNDYQLVL